MLSMRFHYAIHIDQEEYDIAKLKMMVALTLSVILFTYFIQWIYITIIFVFGICLCCVFMLQLASIDSGVIKQHSTLR